jgi:small subunit ribosomal protein S10
MGKARIKLIGKNKDELDNVCKQIVDIAKSSGIAVAGPIPLPTKRLLISPMRTPAGKGNDSFERWYLRIYKRLIEIAGDERTLRQIMRVKVPDTVHIEISLS